MEINTNKFKWIRILNVNKRQNPTLKPTTMSTSTPVQAAKEKLDTANAHVGAEAYAFVRVKKALDNASKKLLAIRDEAPMDKRVQLYEQIEREIQGAMMYDIEAFNDKMNTRDEMEKRYKRALDEEAAESPKPKKAKVCDEK